MAGNPVRWGPLLEGYDLGSLGSLPYKNVSNFREIQSTAQQIAESPASVTWSMLEDLLLVTQFPAELPNVESSRLARLCVRLMKVYTEKNKLFDHLYGLRCVQLLSLVLQVDLLRNRGLLSRSAPHIAKSGPQAVEHWLADSASREVSRINFLSPSIHFQFWSAGLSQEDRHFLLHAFWQARKDMFHVCGHIPGIQGWIIIFAVIWLPLVHKPTEIFRLPVLYYQLKDLMCRYSLATKDDKAFPAAPIIVRWLHNQLTARGYNNPKDPICVDTSNIEEMPTFRRELTTRLNATGDELMDANIAATLLEFLVGYHVRSSERSTISPELQALLEAAYNRLWLEVENVRFLHSMDYRMNAGDLVFAFLQILSVILLEPDGVGRRPSRARNVDPRPVSKVVASILHNVDWVSLMGRVVLLPTLPLDGHPLSLIQYATIKADWAASKEIQVHCQVLSGYDQDAFLALAPSFPDWKKTHDFIKLQIYNNQQKIIDHFRQTEEIWNFMGQVLGLHKIAAKNLWELLQGSLL
ncbi:hypothetical protein RhiLY_01756 [Ceratobasidium sp. AG-Ba]|nr:hypothetical protein RhiLY_01756 [Ceratobasidium sp. AG-Ba]